MAPATRVELFPWDPDSPTHIERLVEQRIQCGWHFERVDPKWRKEQRDGTKLLFWIVSTFKYLYMMPELPSEVFSGKHTS